MQTEGTKIEPFTPESSDVKGTEFSPSEKYVDELVQMLRDGKNGAVPVWGLHSTFVHCEDRSLAQRALQALEQYGFISDERECCANSLMGDAELEGTEGSYNYDNIILPARKVISRQITNPVAFPAIARALAQSYRTVESDFSLWRRNLIDSNSILFQNGLKAGDESVINSSARIVTEVSKDPRVGHDVEVMLQYEINSFGLDGQRVFDAWKESFSYAWEERENPDDQIFYDRVNFFSRIIADNFKVMDTVEAIRPGALQILSQKFGICSFGRYDPEILIRQFDEMGDIQSRYGVVIFPRADWNNAFYQKDEVIKRLSDQLKERGINVRIMECEHKTEIYHKLFQLDRTYGEKFDENSMYQGGNKIDFAVIGGHGTPERIRFGQAEHGGNEFLSKKDFFEIPEWVAKLAPDGGASIKENPRLRRAHNKVKSFFVANPQVVLFSCSTGATGGIGQKLSTEYKARITGPNLPSGVSDIKVLGQGEDSFVLVPVYARGEKSTYLTGQKISSSVFDSSSNEAE